MPPTQAFTHYRRLAVQIKDNFKPREALKGMERLQRRAEEDATLTLEDKIEVYKLIDWHREDIGKRLRA